MTAQNLELAEQFLSLLDPSGVFTFQTFADAPTARALPRVFHGTLDQHASSLTTLNEWGGGVFVMVNAGDGVLREGERSCRTTENVVRVRALFVDLDGAPLTRVLTGALPPDWVVQSSPDRWHAYWRVEDCPLDQFAVHQRALAEKFGGDPSVVDLPRVMRIPGFFHQKKEPFLSRLYLPANYRQLQGGAHA